MRKIKIIIGVIAIIIIFITGVFFYLLNLNKEPEKDIAEDINEEQEIPKEVIEVEEPKQPKQPKQLYKAICSEANDEISKDYFLYDILFYDDLEKCTKVYRNKSANSISDYIVKRNDNSIKKIENVNPYNFAVSSDGVHLGYASGKMDGLNIVFDDKIQKYKGGYKLTLSPNGKNFGYIAWKDNKYYLIVERKDGYGYGNNSMFYHLGLSPDRQRIDYIFGKLGELNLPFNNNGKYEWDFKLILPLFGKNLSLNYLAWKDGKYYFVIEGENSYKYEKNSMIYKLEFSPDSKSVAFDGSNGYVVFDGREEKQYSGGIWPTFSSDGKDFLLANGNTITLNGKEIYRGDKVISPQISSDKEHIAYINIKNNKWQVFSDGIGQKEYDEIYMLEFSPGSKHLTYVGKIKEYEDGKDVYFLVLDGEEIEKYYSEINYNPVYKIVFSPDEKDIAYTVRYNKGINCPWNYYVVLNGQNINKEVNSNLSKNCLIKNCDSCEYHQDLVFSSDGKYFAFVSAEKDSYGIIKVDGFRDMNDIYKHVDIDNKKINSALKTKGRIYNFEFTVDNKFVIFNIIFESGEVYYAKEIIEEN